MSIAFLLDTNVILAGFSPSPPQKLLQNLKSTPPLMDAQIAAIAAVNGLTLVTRNLADFSGFKGLRAKDWLS